MKESPLAKACQLPEPGPVVLPTTAAGGKANVMTMSWHMMVDFEPPFVQQSRFGSGAAPWRLAFWSLLVLAGWGQPLIDFVLWMHMIHLPYVVGPFELIAALVLVLLTGLTGYAIGWFLAYVWNALHRRRY
jgi:hypothetical protein